MMLTGENAAAGEGWKCDDCQFELRWRVFPQIGDIQGFKKS